VTTSFPNLTLRAWEGLCPAVLVNGAIRRFSKKLSKELVEEPK